MIRLQNIAQDASILAIL